MKTVVNLLLSAVVFLLFSVSSFAANSITLRALVFDPSTGHLAQTGQTAKYQASDGGYYDDGSLLAGYPVTQRYNDNGNDTISDSITGLMWIKNGTGPGCNNGVPLLWSDAVTFCSSLNTSNYANHTDWRLPTIGELQSIINIGKIGPAIGDYNTSGQLPWINIPSAEFWSSTTYAGVTAYAWFFSSNTGANDSIGFSPAGTAAKGFSKLYVLPVRGPD